MEKAFIKLPTHNNFFIDHINLGPVNFMGLPTNQLSPGNQPLFTAMKLHFQVLITGQSRLFRIECSSLTKTQVLDDVQQPGYAISWLRKQLHKLSEW